jgi:enamine deaminase RidA (YjgF/YER057c/UK114 family)
MEILEPGKPDFNYLPYKVHRGILYLAGQLAKEGGILKYQGRINEEINEVEAERQAKLCAIHALSWLKIAVDGDINKIECILDLKVYVACNNEFDGMSRLADKASNVFIGTLGEKGRHPRSVIAVQRLPQNAPVMIDLRAAIIQD